MKSSGAVMLAVALAGSTAAERGSAAAAPPTPWPTPPEVRKTVDAIAGRWTGSMTATTPEGRETFGWSVECRLVALGAGAACTREGRLPSVRWPRAA